MFTRNRESITLAQVMKVYYKDVHGIERWNFLKMQEHEPCELGFRDLERKDHSEVMFSSKDI